MKFEIKVEGMACKACENRIQNVLQNIQEVEEVSADYKTGLVIVTLNKEISVNLIKEKLEDIGYNII